jgi:hypothetical protein
MHLFLAIYVESQVATSVSRLFIRKVLSHMGATSIRAELKPGRVAQPVSLRVLLHVETLCDALFNLGKLFWRICGSRKPFFRVFPWQIIKGFLN